MPILPNNCPILERTGDGRPVGRCMHHCPDDVCPRHGLVDIPLRRYRERGDITDGKEWPFQWRAIEEDGRPVWIGTLSGLGPNRSPDVRITRPTNQRISFKTKASEPTSPVITELGHWYKLEIRDHVLQWAPVRQEADPHRVKRFTTREDAVTFAATLEPKLRLNKHHRWDP